MHSLCVQSRLGHRFNRSDKLKSSSGGLVHSLLCSILPGVGELRDHTRPNKETAMRFAMITVLSAAMMAPDHGWAVVHKEVSHQESQSRPTH